MSEISLIYPLVRIEAPGVPEPLLEAVAYETVQDFFTQSEAWRYTVPSLLDWTTAQTFPTITPGTEIPTGTRMKRVDELKYGSDGSSLQTVNFYTRQDLDGIFSDWEVKTGSSPVAWTNDPTSDSPRIIPIATANKTGTLQLRVILVPSTLTDLPEFYYEEFSDAWRWGTLARLLKMPGRDWTNNPLAVYYEGKYMDEVKQAKSRAKAEYGQPIHRTMAYGGI